MRTALIVLGVFVLLPFTVYVLSKIQMVAWMNAKKNMRRQDRDGKKTD